MSRRTKTPSRFSAQRRAIPLEQLLAPLPLRVSRIADLEPRRELCEASTRRKLRSEQLNKHVCGSGVLVTYVAHVSS
jgi:hypothetical protein